MSNFYKSDVECRIFKVGCRMAPISFRKYPSFCSLENEGCLCSVLSVYVYHIIMQIVDRPNTTPIGQYRESLTFKALPYLECNCSCTNL